MSHTLEYYQRMDTEQLIHEMNHARYTVDRQRARQVYEARIRAQKEKEEARSRQRNAALNTQITALQNRIDNLAHQNSDMTNVIRQQNADLRNMQQAHDRQVAEMRTDYNRRIAQLSKENREAIQDLENRMVNEQEVLQEAIDENFRRTTRMISDVKENLASQINAVHMALSNQIASQQSRIDDLDDKFAKLEHSDQQIRENAQEYLEAAVELINATIEYNNENRHNWRSGDLAELLNERNNVLTDLAGGMLTVGVARRDARGLFEAALRYRANVHADEREWQLRHAMAQQCVDAARNDLEISRKIEVDGMEVSVDYWTCGDLQRIEARLDELQEMLDNPNLTNQELEAVAELAETYRQEISVAVTFAMQALQCSLDRKDLLGIAIDHIENTMGNLHPEWEEYFAGDQRLGYRVYLTAPETGERVVLTAEPCADRTDIRNQFRFEILSVGAYVHNAMEADTFTRSIAQALREIDGCIFTAPACTNQVAPAADNGQGSNAVWSNPSKDSKAAAMGNATPVHAPKAPQPQPRPSTVFQPQELI